MAGIYDDWFPDYDAAGNRRARGVGRGGRVLELGIGTGRFALPLASKDVEVHGIDAAAAMIARLRAKPGSERITVAQGNFAEVPVAGQFSLIYIVFNTFFALTSQAEQVQCFRNVAAHLAPGGCFLVEAFVPDLTSFYRRPGKLGHEE